MNRLGKFLVSGLVLAGLAGCNSYTEGRVVEEKGNLVTDRLNKVPEGFIANETVKLGKQSYILTVSTNEGVYRMSVTENAAKPLDVLSDSLGPGDKVKFKTQHEGKSVFGEDRIGYNKSNWITLLEKAK